MEYRYKLMLMLKDTFIVWDKEEKKYFLISNVSSIVEIFKNENTTIEFREYADFDFGTTTEISEQTYLAYLKEGEK